MKENKTQNGFSLFASDTKKNKEEKKERTYIWNMDTRSHSLWTKWAGAFVCHFQWDWNKRGGDHGAAQRWCPGDRPHPLPYFLLCDSGRSLGFLAPRPQYKRISWAELPTAVSSLCSAPSSSRNAQGSHPKSHGVKGLLLVPEPGNTFLKAETSFINTLA